MGNSRKDMDRPLVLGPSEPNLVLGVVVFFWWRCFDPRCARKVNPCAATGVLDQMRF
jgi:hypothetical protein